MFAFCWLPVNSDVLVHCTRLENLGRFKKFTALANLHDYAQLQMNVKDLPEARLEQSGSN